MTGAKNERKYVVEFQPDGSGFMSKDFNTKAEAKKAAKALASFGSVSIQESVQRQVKLEW